MLGAYLGLSLKPKTINVFLPFYCNILCKNIVCV